MMHGKRWIVMGGCLAASWLGTAGAAIAAEKVVLTYGFLSMAIPIEDLETFSAGGETSGELDELLRLANQDPTNVRTALTEPVELNPVVLDLALNTPAGDWMLDRVSETIQPATGQAGRQALRAALIGAASDDNQVTLLELMQVYPSEEIVVQGDRLMETYNRLYEVLEPFEDLADVLGLFRPSDDSD